MRRTTVAVLSSLLLGFVFAPTCLAADITIAEWNFEGDAYNMLLDASVNSYDLADFGIAPNQVQYSSTEHAPGTGSTGSAYFNGASTITTLEELNLSAYVNQNLRISYWIKSEVTSTTPTVIYETTSRIYQNAGGIVGGINNGTAGVSGIGYAGLSWGETPGGTVLDMSYDGVDVNDFATSGASVWEHFVVEYRPTADAANLVKIYKNDVLQADTDPAPWGQHTAITDDQTKFASNTFNLGMRKTNPAIAFTGNLDDVRIIDTATGSVVAEWLFEGNVGDTSFLADTSGNGNDLAIDGTYVSIASSTDTMGGTGTSAYFDGSSLLSTIESLDLTDYQTITVQYKIKDATSNGTGLIMELGLNLNDSSGGEFYLSSKEQGVGVANLMLAPGKSADYSNQDVTQLTSGTWYDMEITMDQTTQNPSDVVTVTQNGVLLTGTDRLERQALPYPSVTDFQYASDYLNIGSRGLDSQFFTGYIDDMKIEIFEDLQTWPPGDANKDNKVDASDATILAGNWQAGVGAPDPDNITWEMGDFNHDGMVDASDATILAGNWQYGVGSASTAVPEPSTILLLISAFAGLVLLRRRRHQ